MPLSNYNSKKRSDKNLYNYVRVAGDRLSLFPGTEVLFSYHYYIFVVMTNQVTLALNEPAPNCHRSDYSSDSLELSLIKSEISQSEECLRSWELRPADNLPGI